jgi:hypothetical protein
MSFIENDQVMTTTNDQHSSLPSYEDWFPPSCKRNSYHSMTTAAADTTSSKAAICNKKVKQEDQFITNKGLN